MRTNHTKFLLINAELNWIYPDFISADILLRVKKMENFKHPTGFHRFYLI